MRMQSSLRWGKKSEKMSMLMRRIVPSPFQGHGHVAPRTFATTDSSLPNSKAPSVFTKKTLIKKQHGQEAPISSLTNCCGTPPPLTSSSSNPSKPTSLMPPGKTMDKVGPMLTASYSTENHNNAAHFWNKTDSLDRLFKNNKEWIKSKKQNNPNYFYEISRDQKPTYLWIGCSDSRVPAEDITGLNPGEVFVHRNIANLVVNNDINVLSVIQFAVEHLKVQDIIVCGHYNCGGVNASLSNHDFGLLDNWLRNIRDVYRLYNDELSQIKDERTRQRRMVEYNVVEQCINLFKIGLVQRHQAQFGFPRIHGLVYDLETGELQQLNIDFKAYIRRYRSIYRLDPSEDKDVLRLHLLQANAIRSLGSKLPSKENRIKLGELKEHMRALPGLFNVEEIKQSVDAAMVCADGMVSLEEVAKYFDRNG